MILRARLGAAARVDRVEQRARRLAEKLGWPQDWLHEWCAYREDPRITIEEFWVRYTLKRLDAAERLAKVVDQDTAERFYQTSDYMLWRNIVHRRHTAWRRVRATMVEPSTEAGPAGWMLEYGCATAPVSAWVYASRPTWHYVLCDLESPHRDYGVWRMRHRGANVDVRGPSQPGWGYHVITLLDVLEHLPDPLSVAKDLVKRLAPRGYLHWNFVGNERHNDLDLATDEQKDETVAYLYDALELVWERDGYRVSTRR